ncbi:ER degradation-enhancing alpha-mannosidase-like 1 [Taphrina deformans PYCC 5710]|uniref:alpha-1,2-Mannosidase n=1 Tax=Taphrina deformans (strain PYCC 5710 / ATCC 11124 / CBS 356.35 / IMI 108563 / JCM 9778 / NBRC 8474) TaxID=1097556 RepID=R4XA00_TAPDE|nr:ER degradation-enhancing alpha-mannosidase-like 1 [Taphrina deformans PYCC 5710]|eukprot:CCG82347.1 ER degradation-enhancing alpha-mannosidase-like 1 [Taphrina deformans PYCC 5710]
MTIHEREDLREQVRSLFYHGFNGYMDHAFPEDELQPLTCTGRGKDKSDATNLGINDVCGDYALTLIDSLDMLPLLGDQTAFELGVRNVIESVTFDVDSKVQIFEVTIRVMGGLLSAHQYASLPELNSTIDWYQGELLNLAKDLGNRLLPAFDSPTGIPFPRINLRHGMQTHTPPDTTETCAAGAGSLVLEFALLSELTGEPRFQAAAVKAFREVWNRRLDLDLVGNTLDADSGNWMSSYTGIGAGVDSFYEYALKSWVFLDEHYFYDVWNKSYTSIQRHIVDDDGFLYRNVHVRTGFQITNYIDSLSAFYSGLLVLAGKVEEAIKSHLIYQSLWTRYRGLPERFNYHSLQVEMPWYPLRPEFIESTYYLYRATKDPFYLAVGKQVVYDLLELRQKCGFAVVSNVVSRTFDNRMESFVLSETLKYLYLLFDESHPLNVLHSNWIFSTEGHPFFRPANRSSRYKMSTDFSVQESVFTESCEIPSGPGFYSAVMSRDDIDLSQFKVGLARLGSNLPDYFPPANVTGTCRPIRIRTDFEVLFGTVASSVLNASASIVQIGKELMIKSLLGFGANPMHRDDLLKEIG